MSQYVRPQVESLQGVISPIKDSNKFYTVYYELYFSSIEDACYLHCAQITVVNFLFVLPFQIEKSEMHGLMET